MAHRVNWRSAVTLVLVVTASFLVMACHAKRPADENRCIPLSGSVPNASVRSTTTTYIYADNQTVAKIIKNSTGTCIEYVVP